MNKSGGSPICLLAMAGSRVRLCLAVFALVPVLTQTRVAAEEATGYPLIRNYSHHEFGGETQNWDVVQTELGLVYFANNAGVLEYDGRSWRLIELPSSLAVLSLAVDSSRGDRIYVGARGDFGYLGPDAVGRLRFYSLLPERASQDESFDQVYTPVVTRSGVYFQSRTTVCHWFEGELSCRTWTAPSGIFDVEGRQYVQSSAGLMEKFDGLLRPVPGGPRFADEEITLLVAYSEGDNAGLLVGTRDFDLLFQRDGSFQPLLADASRHLVKGQLLDGAVLPDGSLALATSLSGLLIVDRQGNIVRQVDQSSGLQDNHVHGVWADKQGGLWLALQSGASRVEAVSPFSRFGEESGLEREWREVIRHQNTVYVRGYKGLFAADLRSTDATSLADSGSQSLQFRKIREIAPPVWSLLTVGGRLLASSSDGIYERRERGFHRIVTYASTPLTMFRSRTRPDRVYVGLLEGVASLRVVDGSWHDEGRIAGIDETITSIAEDESGRLWLVSQRQRVIRVTFAARAASGNRAPNLKETRVYAFDRRTLAGRTSVQEVGNRPVFLTETGIFRFDDASDRFVPAAEFASLVERGRRSFCWITEDSSGSVWVASRKPGAVDVFRKRADGSYVAEKTSRLSLLVWSIYPEPRGDVIWLPTPDYLLRYDPAVRFPASERFATLIRKVTVGEEGVIYGGAVTRAGVAVGSAGRPGDGDQPGIPYRDNSLRFEFAAPQFKEAERNEYQSYLEGFDKAWSSWDSEPNRSYTNLPEGTYRFHVRARNVSGAVTSEAVFNFGIQPPWYRSDAAWAGYGLALCGLLVMLGRLHSKRSQLRLQREREHMELENLREVDQLKSRFFADISHEFRTPLTLILGPVEQLLEGTTRPEVKEQLHLIRRNADYLLRLISELLDLARLESGRMRLHAVRTDVVEAVNSIVMPFTALADRQGIHLTSEGQTGVAAFLDRQVLEKVLNNLLTNALKFTPESGTVSVTISDSPQPRPGETRGDDFIEIAVADSGVGISGSQVQHIFGRFYQGDGARSRGGIGIGLAMVKELVELHHGVVHVDSEQGKGTTFFVRLPKRRACFEENEIIDEPLSAVVADRWVQPPAVEQGTPAEADDRVSESVREAEDATTVLVVEDHVDMRRLLRGHLERHYKVIEAGDGPEALEKAVAWLPDLILSDVMMEPMDGYSLCRALKSHEATCHIPVVLLTARAAREDRLIGLSTRADCYLVKPFDSTELLAQVKNLIEQRRLLRQRFSGSVVLKPSEMAVTPMDEAFLNRVLSAIQHHLGDPDFDVERLGREVGLSRSQLHRKLRALTNQAPTLLIRSVRLYRAAELLRQKAGSVAEIAYSVGFNSQTYFAKCFRERFGCAPREYGQQAVVHPDHLQGPLAVLVNTGQTGTDARGRGRSELREA